MADSKENYFWDLGVKGWKERAQLCFCSLMILFHHTCSRCRPGWCQVPPLALEEIFVSRLALTSDCSLVASAEPFLSSLLLNMPCNRAIRSFRSLPSPSLSDVSWGAWGWQGFFEFSKVSRYRWIKRLSITRRLINKIRKYVIRFIFVQSLSSCVINNTRFIWTYYRGVESLWSKPSPWKWVTGRFHLRVVSLTTMPLKSWFVSPTKVMNPSHKTFEDPVVSKLQDYLIKRKFTTSLVNRRTQASINFIRFSSWYIFLSQGLGEYLLIKIHCWHIDIEASG